jgi:ankyrin repeat protein
VHARFIEENPGRQTMSGSFNPIDDGEWSGQVYVKPTQKIFAAIAARDRDAVQNLLREEIDINQRDHVGRTTLHVAILSNTPEIACDLIDAGARITANSVLDFPTFECQNVTFPISTAIRQQHYAVLAVMLAHGVKLVLDEADITRAQETM